MKLQKFEHACFAVTKDRGSIVVDPGNFTTDFEAPAHVAAIIITHKHADHYDPAKVTRLIEHHPSLILYGPADLAAELPEETTFIAVEDGATHKVADFTLSFHGGAHAPIHADITLPHNFGVCIDNRVFYPGDNWVKPPVDVDTLLLPVAAPWLTISDVVEYARVVAPRQIIPTHDGMYNKFGRGLPDRMVPSLVPNAEYIRPSSDIEI